MPSKKRKYNARFPAGRIKKIMQTDEEVGKVAQAVPIIIYLTATPRTLELFVESLLSKAMQVTVARNAKTLSPSHVKQCILAESRFDFLRDLVKNIPDVSAAEEKEIMSAENSPNSSSFSDISVPRRIAREDSNSSSSSDIKIQQIIQAPRDNLQRIPSAETEPPSRTSKTETVTSTIISTDAVMDLSKKSLEEEAKPLRPANFYQETLVPDEPHHRSVIKINPTYATPQPSTSNYTNLNPMEPVQTIEIPVPKQDNKPMYYVDVRPHNNSSPIASIAVTPNSILQTTMSPRMTIPIPRTLETSYSTPRTPVTPTPRTPVTPTPRTPVTPTPRTPVIPTPSTPVVTSTPRTPVTPILKIDFTKNIANPEIKVLDTAVANIVGVTNETTRNSQKTLQRQNSKPVKSESKKIDAKPVVRQVVQPVDIDHINSGNLQIDEDYDT